MPQRPIQRGSWSGAVSSHRVARPRAGGATPARRAVPPYTSAPSSRRRGRSRRHTSPARRRAGAPGCRAGGACGWRCPPRSPPHRLDLNAPRRSGCAPDFSPSVRRRRSRNDARPIGPTPERRAGARPAARCRSSRSWTAPGAPRPSATATSPPGSPGRRTLSGAGGARPAVYRRRLLLRSALLVRSSSRDSSTRTQAPSSASRSSRTRTLFAPSHLRLLCPCQAGTHMAACQAVCRFRRGVPIGAAGVTPSGRSVGLR